MAVTQSNTVSNSVVTAYEQKYLTTFSNWKCWINVAMKQELEEIVGGKGSLRGKTIQIPMFGGLNPPTSSLSESSDVTPSATDDDSMTVTLAEEGDVVQISRMLDMTTYLNLSAAIGEQQGAQAAERIDKVLRNAVVFNVTDTIYGGDATTRATLSTASTADTFTVDKLIEAVTRAQSRGVPSLPDGTYFTIIHPALMKEITAASTDWRTISDYADPKLITGTDISSWKPGGVLPGEVGQLYGVRFIRHPYGKLFLGAGAQVGSSVSTTLDGAVAAGDTTITVASASNIAVGQFLTIGTVESSTTAYPTTEQVEVTGIGSAPTINIRGAGNAPTNWGLKFAHSNGAAVVRTFNVATVPIMGPRSMVVAYPKEVGITGEFKAHEPAYANIPRFFNYWWYWVGGASIVSKNVVQLEFATGSYIHGNN